jgi:hypothetical protein
LANADSTNDAISLGQKQADEILARRKTARERRASVLSSHSGRLELTVNLATTAGALAAVNLQTAGFLVAAGDSWFDYPLYDVLKLLDDNYGYNVESSAHRGIPSKKWLTKVDNWTPLRVVLKK